ncbi:MAG: copper resistance protein CopC [Myxococcota bacterium]
MSFVRIGTERLLLALFWIARSAFLAQGLAMCTALLAVSLVSRQGSWPWVGIALRSSLLIGATLFASGVLVYVARHHITPRAGDDAQPTWPWLLGLSLAGLPALAFVASSPLLALWREIGVLLDGIGFWEALTNPDPFGGIILLPIFAALFVPVLETAGVFFLSAVPLVLIVLLLTRSRLFPRIFSMLIVCQAGLVLASLLASDAFSRVASEAIAAMTTEQDAELQRAAEKLGHATGVLSSTAAALVAPMLAYLVWLPFLLLSRQIGSFFSAGSDPAPAPVPAWTAAPIEHAFVQPAPMAQPTPSATREHRPPAKAAHAPGRRARVALVVLGALMLVFSAGQALRSRAPYESSDPAPGAALVAPPEAVRVSFGAALDPSSSFHVTRTTPGENATRVAASSGLDPDDPERRTLKAELPAMSGGLYRVAWHSAPASGGIARYGAFYFGVGMPVPESLAESEPLEGRDSGERRHRHALAGGVILIALGVLLPWLPRDP